MFIQTIREAFNRLMGSARRDKPLGKFQKPLPPPGGYGKMPPGKGVTWGSGPDGKPVKKPSA